jgi:3-deoxy-D-manno-octulosonate 8-phosphate phosphatase (KDO 8-P phosphatase)
LNARKATPLRLIELLVLDVDGVLTDGRLYFGARGEALKVFDVRDGHGIKLAMSSGVQVAVVSGRRSAAVAARMRELGVRHVIQGCADKVAALQALCADLALAPLACACLVDDTPDLPLMSAVGLAAAVADAHPLVLSAAHWIARAEGGRGAVREFCDALLRARAGMTPPQRAKALLRVNAPLRMAAPARTAAPARVPAVARRAANRSAAAKVR